MSNYRRLISYIYAYEGGVKGKNIGFARIETRGSQCKIIVSVKKVFVGSSDIGVYLLSGDREIFLGNIFIRGGAGEFRTTVAADNVERSGLTVEQCFGLSVHDVNNPWRSYTTIWEDAVSQAAEIRLEDAVGRDEVIRERQNEETVRRAVQEIEEEFPVTAEDNALLEEDKKRKGGEDRDTVLEGENHSKEISEDREETMGAADLKGGSFDSEMKEKDPATTLPTEETPAWQSGMAVSDAEIQNPSPGITPGPEIQNPSPGIIPGPEIQNPSPGIIPGPEIQNPDPGMKPGREIPGPLPERIIPDPGMPIRNSGNEIPSQEASGQNSDAVSLVNGGQRSFSPPPFRPREGTRMPSYRPKQDTVNTGGLRERPLPQPQFQHQPESRINRALPPQEPEEEWNHEKIWEKLRKEHAKITSFDSENGCEILTIKPQDIGLLPRETWGFGNNSFLLHGYYNYRYLILARLNTLHGMPRYLLGVPGHYYTNEKYMASMFGFPNFVLSKEQPAQDGRFGFWYTDIKMES